MEDQKKVFNCLQQHVASCILRKTALRGSIYENLRVQKPDRLHEYNLVHPWTIPFQRPFPSRPFR